MITALFALVAFFFSGARAETPTATPASSFPRTIIVTMMVQGVENDPARAPEVQRACDFLAQHAKNIGYAVADYCKGPSELANSILPQPGDPVIFVVFAGSPVDPAVVQRALPPQAVRIVSGASAAAFLPVPFTEDGDTGLLVGGDHRKLNATVHFPGDDLGLMPRTMLRCLFAVNTSGNVTFEEATACLIRVSKEENEEPLRVYGGWDPLFDSGMLIYQPRVEPADSATSRTARALQKYDERRRERKPPPLAQVPEEDADPSVVTADPPPQALPTEPPKAPPAPTQPPSKARSWSTPKVVLTTAGAATTVTAGIALATVYDKAGTLAKDISAGEYGVAGDSRLTAAVKEYNRLGGTVPWLWAGVGAGVVLSGTGIVLPMPKDSTVEATVSVGPSGFMFNGTF